MRPRATGKVFATAACLLLLVSFVAAQSAGKLVIRADQQGARISPNMWGIFFEDINLGADGGLYAELVKNRSFEFPDALMGWAEVRKDGAKGTLRVMNENPVSPANPHFLRIELDAATGLGVSNEGFRGIGIASSATYLFSVFGRTADGGSPRLRVRLVGNDGRVLAEKQIGGLGREWKKHEASLRPGTGDPKARLELTAEGAGALDLDMVSLFPEKTWRNRRNGLRSDLAQLLADLKPGFLRFPGGCIVEGRALENRYQWKTTIGEPAERRLIINRWNNEFKHRPTPDYFQSFGLGFYEYFLLAEDIGAEPLPILNCGMACQFNSGELVPLDQLDPYIQDMLDLIEFANGSVTSQWGKKRADLGHRRPFGLNMIGVGNEQWGTQYMERYEQVAKVLKAKHPEIQLISSSGPNPDGKDFDLAWNRLRELKADVIDEHYYRPPSWFVQNTKRYDNYNRQGPKVFAGEFAAQSVRTGSPDNRNTWECALAEAAFMTGLERNADVVVMASYAPLSGHVEGWQWTPNLIWFDNLRSFGTANYYVQQLFGVNRGDFVLPVEFQAQPSGTSPTPSVFASATRDERSGDIILKVVNSSAEAASLDIEVAGAEKLAPSGTMITLTSDKLSDENSLDQPRKVAPVSSPFPGVSRQFSCTFKPISLTVLRLHK